MLSFRLLSLVALLSIAGIAHAADYVFTNPAGGDWHNAANWSPTGIPAVGDRATIGETVVLRVVALGSPAPGYQRQQL